MNEYTKYLVAILSVSVWPLLAAAQTVNIPDVNLEAAIRQELDKSTGDITRADMEALTKLEAPNVSIADLTGLEHAINLERLVLNDNEIRDVDPVSGLVISHLNLRNNHIDVFPGSLSLQKINFRFDNNVLIEPQRLPPEVTDGERLVNLSTRGWVGQGDAVLIDGFFLSGNKPSAVLIRGIGPTLGGMGVVGYLTFPEVLVHRIEAGNSPELVAKSTGESILVETLAGYPTSNHLGSTIQIATENVGAFPLERSNIERRVGGSGSGGRFSARLKIDPGNFWDAVLYTWLEPGNYTVTLSGKDGAEGIGMIEVYQVQ